MHYLLDTQALIWVLEQNPRLSANAQNIVAGGSARLAVSIVSFWEMAIKISIGKLTVQFSLEDAFRDLPQNGLDILPIQPAHILQVRDLPLLHRDPFDRIIIAQAIAEDLTLISSDNIFGQYPARVVW